jgi:hypothetical protein
MSVASVHEGKEPNSSKNDISSENGVSQRRTHKRMRYCRRAGGCWLSDLAWVRVG